MNRRDSGPKMEPSFSIYEFKHWLTTQDQLSLNRKPEEKQECGFHVSSRLGVQRLESQIEQHNPSMKLEDRKLAARQFKQSGGTLIEMHGLIGTVQLESMKFDLPRTYMKD